jgi:hypothetical protein
VPSHGRRFPSPHSEPSRLSHDCKVSTASPVENGYGLASLAAESVDLNTHTNCSNYAEERAHHTGVQLWSLQDASSMHVYNATAKSQLTTVKTLLSGTLWRRWYTGRPKITGFLIGKTNAAGALVITNPANPFKHAILNSHHFQTGTQKSQQLQ